MVEILTRESVCFVNIQESQKLFSVVVLGALAITRGKPLQLGWFLEYELQGQKLMINHVYIKMYEFCEHVQKEK